MIDSKSILVAAGLLGGLAVVFGAFGAHALTDSMLNTFEIGVRYQAWQASVLLFLGLASVFSPDLSWRISAGFMIAGTILFSFSLYGLALGGPRWLGPVTPLGGLLLIVGWIILIFAAWNFRFPR